MFSEFAKLKAAVFGAAKIVSGVAAAKNEEVSWSVAAQVAKKSWSISFPIGRETNMYISLKLTLKLIHVLFSLHQPRSQTHKAFFKKRTCREQWRTVAFINFCHQLTPRLLTYPRSLIVPRSSVQLLSYFGVVVAAGIRVVILRETHNLTSGLWF